MAEDIGKYTFYFEREVEDLRSYLGPKADNIAFVEVAIENEGASPKVTLPHVIAGNQIRGGNLSRHLEWIIDDYTKEPDLSSRMSPIVDIYANGLPIIGNLVCIRKSEDFSERFGEENKHFLHLFGLYHETGHALNSDGPRVDEDHPLRECRSDAYAVLRCFQKFGRNAVPYLTMISWSRSYDALEGETSHLTTTVIDRIIEDSAHRDFSELTADETIELARDYAENWTPKASVISAARSFFWQEDESVTLLDILSSTCLSSSSCDLAFLVGAKVVQPLLQPKEIIYYGEPFQLREEERQQYATTIGSRLAGMSMRGLFNTEAAKPTIGVPFTDVLPVTLPPGQKQLKIFS